MSKHHVTLVHHTPTGVTTHHRTYEARNPHHALEQLREEISRDEIMLHEIQAAHAVHHHVHRDTREQAMSA